MHLREYVHVDLQGCMCTCTWKAEDGAGDHPPLSVHAFENDYTEFAL